MSYHIGYLAWVHSLLNQVIEKALIKKTSNLIWGVHEDQNFLGARTRISLDCMNLLALSLFKGMQEVYLWGKKPMWAESWEVKTKAVCLC